MDSIYRCSSCYRRIRAKARAINKRKRCPNCGVEHVVPLMLHSFTEDFEIDQRFDTIGFDDTIINSDIISFLESLPDITPDHMRKSNVDLDKEETIYNIPLNPESNFIIEDYDFSSRNFT